MHCVDDKSKSAQDAATVTVRWQQWVETWRHVSAGGYGVYLDQSRAFTSTEEAHGFAAGLRMNPLCRHINTGRESHLTP